MPFFDALSTIFTTSLTLILIGVVMALGLLRGLWKGFFKKAESSSDYFITLVIYICTDVFLGFCFGFILCLLLIYLPALLGVDLPFLNSLPK